MTDWQDVSDLTPYDHLQHLLIVAADTLRDAAAKSGEIVDPDEIQALLTAINTNVGPAVLYLGDELLSLLEHEPGAAA